MPTHRQVALMVALALAYLIQPAAGCIWDKDTLAAEARGVPGIIDILTGRFERNPPLYYEMRLERVTAQIAREPEKLELYDDAGVACDRLHRGDEAIAWMARKREVLDRSGPPPVKMPDKASATEQEQRLADHWYRYYANLGTFHAHRWVRGKRDRLNIADMETGRDLIAKAIALNPDAHFGREKYQLKAMEWIIEAPRRVEYNPSALPFMGDDWSRSEEAAQGLAGLIALGDAWQSLDIHVALGNQLGVNSRATLALLAQHRVEELIASGARSIHPDAPRDPAGLREWAYVRIGAIAPQMTEIESYFPKARAAADRWHAQRETFMLAQLREGKHPDTHADFWTGYEEEPPYPLPPETTAEHMERILTDKVTLAVLAFIAVAAIAAGIWRAAKRKRSHSAAATH